MLSVGRLRPWLTRRRRNLSDRRGSAHTAFFGDAGRLFGFGLLRRPVAFGLQVRRLAHRERGNRAARFLVQLQQGYYANLADQ